MFFSSYFFAFVLVSFECVLLSSLLYQMDPCHKCFVIQGRWDRSMMYWRNAARWVLWVSPPINYNSFLDTSCEFDKQTSIKSCSAAALLRAEQGPCEPNEDFVNKFGEQ